MFTFKDRAANYGDGIFTTMLVQNSAIALYERHVARLLTDSERLGFRLGEAALRNAITNELQSNSSGVLKLLISSGEGGRGYSRSKDTVPTLHFSWHEVPDTYSLWQREGVALGISDIKLASQPLLAGCKHLNRLEQVMIKQSLAATNFDDVVVCNYEGNVVEASAANLFWLIGDEWFTPSIETSGVAGVMRNFMLDYFNQHNYRVSICQQSPTALIEADTMFMCNALMKLIPVKKLSFNDTSKQFDCTVIHKLQHAVEVAFKDEYVSFG